MDVKSIALLWVLMIGKGYTSKSNDNGLGCIILLHRYSE